MAPGHFLGQSQQRQPEEPGTTTHSTFYSKKELGALHALQGALKELTPHFSFKEFKELDLRPNVEQPQFISTYIFTSLSEYSVSIASSLDDGPRHVQSAGNILHILAGMFSEENFDSTHLSALFSALKKSKLEHFFTEAIPEESKSTPLEIAIAHDNWDFAVALVRHGSIPATKTIEAQLVHAGISYRIDRDTFVRLNISGSSDYDEFRLPDIYSPDTSDFALRGDEQESLLSHADSKRPKKITSFDDDLSEDEIGSDGRFLLFSEGGGSMADHPDRPVDDRVVLSTPRRSLHTAEDKPAPVDQQSLAYIMLVYQASTQELARAVAENKETKELEQKLNRHRKDLYDIVLSSSLNADLFLRYVSTYSLDQAPFPNGMSITGYTLAQREYHYATDLFKAGYKKLTTREQVSYVIPDHDGALSDEELSEKIFTKCANLDIKTDGSFRDDALAYYNAFPSPFQLYLYLNCYDEEQDQNINQRGLSFFQVASNLLYLSAKDRPLDGFLELSGIAGHRNESDFLLLLNDSPDQQSPSDDRLGYMEKIGLPIINRPPNASPAALHWALSRIGSTTYSFSRYRFDSMNVKERDEDGHFKVLSKPLMASFGGEYISAERRENREIVRRFGPQPYGAQFFFAPGTIKGDFSYFDLTEKERSTRAFNDETTVAACQGYYLINHPSAGLLIVRNSSPEFGRELLPQTAYYLDPEEAKHLTKQDLQFISSKLLYACANPVSLTHLTAVRRINFLLDELKGFFEIYNHWKYNTSVASAWDDLFEVGQKELVGGHLSPGFGAFVDHLSHLYQYYSKQGDSTVALAFVHPDFPSWRQYTFKNEEGRNNRFLIVDDELITCLKGLAQGNGTDEQMTKTNFRNFAQQAGLDKEAELVITMI